MKIHKLIIVLLLSNSKCSFFFRSKIC